ncbi:hypothetical protein AUJ84_00360 [Candidatus Pacearchaeota archaeon CG1_02_32_132]|nr:MAG: hypothetical protein AUJ84_00360 [Candidatus Pacearchaeota archaeon CG1_02_32_132]
MIYQPSDDSYLLESQVKKYAQNKSCLDMGSGSGILAEACRKAQASSVLAVDINPESVKYLKDKFRNTNIKIIKSNLFQKVKGKFDLIIFNPPYLPLDAIEPKDSRLATTGGKKGDEISLKFLNQAKIHMNKDSIIILLLSSLTQKIRIIALLSKLSLKNKILAEKRLFMEKLEVWEIKHNNQ